MLSINSSGSWSSSQVGAGKINITERHPPPPFIDSTSISVGSPVHSVWSHLSRECHWWRQPRRCHGINTDMEFYPREKNVQTQKSLSKHCILLVMIFGMKYYRLFYYWRGKAVRCSRQIRGSWLHLFTQQWKHSSVFLNHLLSILVLNVSSFAIFKICHAKIFHISIPNTIKIYSLPLFLQTWSLISFS